MTKVTHTPNIADLVYITAVPQIIDSSAKPLGTHGASALLLLALLFLPTYG
jgi:hypothetical protein